MVDVKSIENFEILISYRSLFGDKKRIKDVLFKNVDISMICFLSVLSYKDNEAYNISN